MSSIVDRVLRGAASVTSPGGNNARLTVLLYHRVLDRSDALNAGEPSAAQFNEHMSILSRIFRVLPLDEALSRLSDGTLPSRAMSVTFDDGYRDNVEVALPILRRYGLHATFFISTGMINGGRMMHDSVIETVRRFDSQPVDLEWLGLGRRKVDDISSRQTLINEIIGKIKYLPFEARREACERLAAMVSSRLPDDLMMNSEQVESLHRGGMRIGAHTHEHPILSKVAADEAKAQIIKSRDVLSGILGQPPTMFAYPNGKPGLDYGCEHVAMVKDAGFSAAVSVAFGTVSRASDHLQIPRFCPWDRDPRRFAFRLLRHPMRYRESAHA